MRSVLAAVLLAASIVPASAGPAANTVAQPQPMPFTRSGPTMTLPVATTPRTYAIYQMPDSRSYRGVNECGVDIVVTSVTVSQPVVTEPVTMGGETIPNVQRVTSQTDNVNRFTGTFYFARTARNFGSSPNPVAGNTRYVSVMALSEPTKECAFRMLYGMGY